MVIIQYIQFWSVRVVELNRFPARNDLYISQSTIFMAIAVAVRFFA